MSASDPIDKAVALIKFHLKPTRLSDDELRRRAAMAVANAVRGPQFRMAVIMDLANIFTDGAESNLDTDAVAAVEAAAADIFAHCTATP